jgi:hypothetical protein
VNSNGEPLLVLTGQRDQRRCLARVVGAEVWLTFLEFELLCTLVAAVMTSPTGLVTTTPITVFRLRSKIELATGEQGLGKRLIQACSNEEYRIAIGPHDVGCTECVCHLPPLIVGPELLGQLRRLLPQVKSV